MPKASPKQKHRGGASTPCTPMGISSTLGRNSTGGGCNLVIEASDKPKNACDWLVENTEKSRGEVVLALLHTTGEIAAAFNLLIGENAVWKQVEDEGVLFKAQQEAEQPSNKTRSFWVQEEDLKLLAYPPNPEEHEKLKKSWRKISDEHGRKNAKHRTIWHDS